MKADDRTSLLRRLSVIRRRVKATVLELTEAMNRLPDFDELSRPSMSGGHAESCNLHAYCICLEVALDEATKWARKLENRAKAIGNGGMVAESSPPVAPAEILLAADDADSATVIARLFRTSGYYEGVLAEGVRAVWE